MRSALGKGLSQLIGEQADHAPTQAAIESIVPNARQPREVFHEAALQELADSIAQVGVLQPLVVRPLAEGKYELIAGERRLRASKIAGLKSVPIIVRSADNLSSLELALIENVQREDISPLESAKAYRKLLDEFGLTQEQVASKVGKARASVANTLRLLRLPPRVLSGLESGLITEGHARALLGVESEVLQIALYDQILERSMSVREVERAVRSHGSRTRNAKPKKPQGSDVALVDPAWRAVQEGLEQKLGTPVKLQGSERGGKIVIDFFSEEDLSRIVESIGIEL